MRSDRRPPRVPARCSITSRTTSRPWRALAADSPSQPTPHITTPASFGAKAAHCKDPVASAACGASPSRATTRCRCRARVAATASTARSRRTGRISTRPTRSRRGSTRRCGETPRSCSSSPGERPRSTLEVAARLRELRPRRLRLLRRLGLRARARARAAPAHQPRRPEPRGPGAAARGHRLAGPDARVDLGAADGHGARGLADEAPGAPAGDDRGGRRAADSRSRAGSSSGSARPRTSASRRSRRSRRCNERHGHIQEVILQNFVPHPRYYGREVAEIADEAARERWAEADEEGGCGAGARVARLGHADLARRT